MDIQARLRHEQLTGILFALIGVLLVLSSDAFQVVEAPTTEIIVSGSQP